MPANSETFTNNNFAGDGLLLTLFDKHYHEDEVGEHACTDLQTVLRIHAWAWQQPLFNWQHSHNFCEARAEALSLLLEAAGIAHAKCWVFGAAFLRKGYVGGLKYHWNYHVAIAIQVKNQQEKEWWVIDPSLNEKPLLLEAWAASVTEFPHSYHFLRLPNYYIFPQQWMGALPWHKRHHRNFRWAMQGLSGISSLSSAGKARLAFQKKKIANTTQRFMRLRSHCRQLGSKVFEEPA